MLNLMIILQHGSDLNANVTYVVLITVKTKSLSNQHKTFSCFNVNPLLRDVRSSRKHFENLAANAGYPIPTLTRLLLLCYYVFIIIINVLLLLLSLLLFFSSYLIHFITA